MNKYIELLKRLESKQYWTCFVDVGYNTLDIYPDQQGLTHLGFMELSQESSDQYLYDELDVEQILDLSEKMKVTFVYGAENE